MSGEEAFLQASSLSVQIHTGLVKRNNIFTISLQSNTAMSELTAMSSNLLVLQDKVFFT